MNKIIKLVIADDHPVFLKGLIDVIREDNSLDVLSYASDGEQALNQILASRPDVAILDINMPGLNGFEVVKKLGDNNSTTKIIFLTMHKEEDIFNKALDIGVMGYILKENASEDIMECIKTVAETKHYISPIISDYLINRTSYTSAKKNNIEKLTCMEKNILKQISNKKTSKEIAETLFISIRTVENHRMNICNKLELHGCSSLLLFAVENKHLL